MLELLPGVPTSHARRRLQLFDTDDASNRPLTEKLLERPALLARIKEQLRPGQLHQLLRGDRAETPLGSPRFPCWAPTPPWATGAARPAAVSLCPLRVPHPPGSDLVHNLDDLSEVTATLWEEHPKLKRCVIKLNEGISGEGNAALDLLPLGLEACSAAGRRQRLRQELEHLPMPAQGWLTLLKEQGRWRPAEGGDQLSLSVQGTIHPDGRVEVLSTHEQILGANGQTYQGCRFPADQAYRLDLMRHGQAVGEALAAEGP